MERVGHDCREFSPKNYKMLLGEKHSVQTSRKGGVWRMEKVGIISPSHKLKTLQVYTTHLYRLDLMAITIAVPSSEVLLESPRQIRWGSAKKVAPWEPADTD